MSQWRRYFLVLIILSNFSFNGCGTGVDSLSWTEVLEYIHKEFPEVRHLSTQDLAQWVADHKRKPPLIFDTREENEYAVSHLPDAQYLNPNSNFVSEIKRVEKNAPIVVYCSVGYRSSVVARKLRKLGYTNVFNLEGSIFKWANEDRIVVRNGKSIREVHPYDEHWGQLLEKKYHPNGSHFSINRR